MQVREEEGGPPAPSSPCSGGTGLARGFDNVLQKGMASVQTDHTWKWDKQNR